MLATLSVHLLSPKHLDRKWSEFTCTKLNAAGMAAALCRGQIRVLTVTFSGISLVLRVIF